MPETASRPLPTDGSVRPITRWGTPVMHQTLKDVTAYDDELRSLVADMFTVYSVLPIPLAAQVASVAVTLLVSTALHRWVERPANAFGKRLASGDDQRSPAREEPDSEIAGVTWRRRFGFLSKKHTAAQRKRSCFAALMERRSRYA